MTPPPSCAAGSRLDVGTTHSDEMMNGGTAMHRARIWTPLALVAVFVCGCYGAKTLRQPIAIDNTETNVDTLLARQDRLQATVADLRARSARQEEMLRGLRADTQTRMDELSESIGALSNRVGDTIERRTYNAPQTWRAPAAEPPAPAPGDTVGTAPPASPGPAQTKAIYDAAYLDLNRGNYSLALLEFRDFLSKAPDSELADNAQYWIGECYYAQRDFKTAITEFSKVESDYPKGDKVPAAMLKVAYSQLQLDDRAAARASMRDLIRRFPKSDEATQARAKLPSIE